MLIYVLHQPIVFQSQSFTFLNISSQYNPRIQQYGHDGNAMATSGSFGEDSTFETAEQRVRCVMPVMMHVHTTLQDETRKYLYIIS